MRIPIFSIFMTITLLIVLTACGEKSEEAVLKALDEQVEKVESYKMNAKMTFETGEEPQEYNVEIWHEKPRYYRIKLENENKEQSQIILRNDDGVFVLTPALNKSFRFQSEWPENNSQIYLYESLVNDVLNDSERLYIAEDKDYIFTTKTNYQNKNFSQQEITFNKKSLAPKMIKVMDQDANVLITAQFSNVEFNPEFDKDAFEMERNMTGAKLDIPTMSSSDESTSILYPLYTAETTLTDEQEVTQGDGKQVVMTYTNDDHSFTLIQKKAEAAIEASAPVQFVHGEPVDLGFTIGVLTGDTISWTYDGMEFLLASADLDEEEMVAIARSVQGLPSK